MPEKLKKGWVRVEFGDVVELCRERSSDPAGDGFERYIGLEHLEPGDLKIRSWGNVADGTTFTNVFRAGQVLFGKRRAYQRKVAVADFDGVCSGDIYVLRSKNDHLLQDLLPFICQTDGFFAHAVGTSAGSLSPRTNWDSLASYEFALPPIEEQRRIADLFIATEIAKQYLIKAQKMTRSLLSSAANALIRENDLRSLFSGGLIKPPTDWVSTTFGDICERITYGFTNPMPTTDIGPWMVTATDIKDGHIQFDGVRHTSRVAFDNDLTPKSRVHVGDVLLTKDGTLGEVAVVDREDICVNQSVAILRPKPTVMPRFLAWLLRAPVMQWRVSLDIGGSAVKHIYITKVAMMPCLLPPLNVQQDIVNALDRTELMLEKTSARLFSLNKMVDEQLQHL